MAWSMGLLGASGGALGAFELIQTVELSSPASSIIFSSIPSDFKHLHLRGTVRTNRGTGVDQLYVTFNGITSGYREWRLRQQSSTLTQSGSSGRTALEEFYVCDQAGPADAFSPFLMDLPDYTNTNIYKSALYYTSNQNSITALASGNIPTNNAITSIDIKPVVGTSINTTSRISLYGIKGV